MIIPHLVFLVGPSRNPEPVALSAFASPDALDPQLLQFLEGASERLCNWIGSAAERGPLPALRVLPDAAPQTHGRTMEQLLDDLQQVMDGAFQPSHPGAIAHLDPPPLSASIAADLICAGLNNNLLAEELSPSLSHLERQLCAWFAERIGFPAGSSGVAASGGTLSNLIALVAARHHAGLDHTPDAVVVVSADAHVSWHKAARVMGLQNDAVREIPVDGQGRIDLQQLEDELTALSREGRPCIAVVATAGTTVRGAIDPVSALADLCSRLGRWLHVDGAIGAVFALSPTSTHLLDGIARADSITVNPQKVLGITKTSSLLLVRNPSVLAEAFSTGLPYMEPALEHDHGGELGLQGSRPAEVLKLWLGLRQLGESGIEQVLSAAIARREYLQQQLDPNRLMILSGPLHVLACRPQRGQAQQHESWSIETRRLLLSQGIMLSRPLHQGRHHLKAVLGNPHTHDGLLDQLASALNQSVEVRP